MIYKRLPGAAHCLDPHCFATPEGGILYVGPLTVTYIGPVSNSSIAPEVRVLHTRLFIKAIDVDPGWGKLEQDATLISKKKQGKFFAIVAEDRTVQIWDFELGRAVCGHSGHINSTRQYEGDKETSHVLLSYMCNGNVLSLDSHDMVIYCVASNSYVRRPTFTVGRHQQITALKCSPYHQNVFAAGTSRGLVLIYDLKAMGIRYSTRGHSSAVIDFAWRRFGIAKPKESLNVNKSSNGDKEEPVDIRTYEYLDKEFDASKAKNQALQPSDIATVDAELPVFDEIPTPCRQISCVMSELHLNNDELDKHLNDETNYDDYCLAENESSSTNSPINQVSESTEDSIEILQYSSSDDAIVVDGDESKPKHQVLHHIYHQAEVHNLAESLATAALDEVPVSSQSAAIADTQLDDNKSLSPVDLSESLSRYDDADILLISAGDDATVSLWNARNSGKCDSIFKRTCNKNVGKYTGVAFLEDGSVLTNTKQNELSVYEVHCQEYKRYSLKEDPSRCLKLGGVTAFTICPQTQNVWCITKNRKLLLVNAKTNEICAEYGNVSLNTHAISECPDDMNKIALALSDRRLGIFDISKLTSTRIAIDNLMPVSDAIVCMAWSPDSTKLAYGTKDGKVGVFNIETGKHMTSINSMFSSQIYSIAWHEAHIYYVSNQRLFAFDVEWEKSEPLQITEVDKATAVNLRAEYLIVGTVDGHLHLYVREKEDALKFKRVQQLILMPRYITNIVWNPLTEDLLAVVGNDDQIFVIHLNREAGDLEVKQKLKAPKGDDKRSLISSVKWSNYNENLLLTCGYQGNVCIWDLTKPEKEILSKDYHCPLFSAIFLPSNENIVMCSGKSISIEFFNIKDELDRKNDEKDCNKQPVPNPLCKVQWASKIPSHPSAHTLSTAEKKRAKKASRRDAKRNGQENPKPAEAKIDSEESVDGFNAVAKTDIHNMGASYHIQNDSNITGEKKVNAGFMTHSSTLLYLTKKELNKDALDKMYIVLTADATSIQESVLCSKLFGTNAAAKELLSLELHNHKGTDTRAISSICLTQMNLTLKDEIIRCIENKTLSEWHVSLAPTIDYSFWQLCCNAFADQLAEQGYILQAATYMMAAHKKSTAIQLLLEKSYFREALLFARVYLPTTNPIQDKIVRKWVESLERTGNLAAAALICVLENDMLRAYQFLKKIRTPTEQITGLLDLIKLNGDLHVVLGEKKPTPGDASNSESITDAICGTRSASENTN